MNIFLREAPAPARSSTPARGGSAARAALLGTLMSLAAAGSGAAQDGSLADVVKVDILPGWRQADGQHIAGLRIRMAEGWKTYWRVPGESGIPPQIAPDSSTNLAAVEMMWPQPKTFDIGGFRSIGYSGEVILPLAVTAEQSGGDIALRARVDLGVCEDICLPVSVDVAALLPAAASAPDPAIAAAMKKQPPLAGETTRDSLSCAVEPIEGGLRVTAAMQAPGQGGEEMAIFELADPTVWIESGGLSRDGARVTAAADFFPVSGSDYPLAGEDIRITLLGSGGALDVRGCPLATSG